MQSDNMASTMRPIKLAPIRMSELSGPSNQVPNKPPVKNTYQPPNRRNNGKIETPVISSIDFNTAAFPSIGTSVVKQASFGGFKQKILDLIEKDKLDEIERNRIPEVDYNKMTRDEKINAGWSILPLGNIREAGIRLNETISRYNNNIIPSLDFEEYK
jgi:hypothetical protein